jgi:hypothetical protein
MSVVLAVEARRARLKVRVTRRWRCHDVSRIMGLVVSTGQSVVSWKCAGCGHCDRKAPKRKHMHEQHRIICATSVVEGFGFKSYLSTVPVTVGMIYILEGFISIGFNKVLFQRGSHLNEEI